MEDIKYKYPNMPWSSLFRYVTLPRNEKLIFNVDTYIPLLEEYLNKTDKRYVGYLHITIRFLMNFQIL